MKEIFVLLVILSLCLGSEAKLGIDVSQLHSQEVLKCFIDKKYEFLSVRAYKSYGAFDSNAPLTLANAEKAGMTDLAVYMFPCLNDTKTPASQVAEMIAGLKNSKYSRIWLDIETNPSPNCAYTKDYDKNCQFIKQLVQAVQNSGKKVGIYASRYMWTSIMGGLDKCSFFSNLPLWYAHYDNSPNFNDWVAFAGWKAPTIKQFSGTTNECGGSVDQNYKA